MFCKSCGNRLSKELKFCNACGERVASEISEIEKTIATSFSIGGVLVGVIGILGFAILMKEFLENGVRESIILLFSLIYLGAVAGICWILVRNVLKMANFGRHSVRNQGQDNSAEVPLLKVPETGKLEEAREPMASVTEHTTRTLDKTPVER